MQVTSSPLRRDSSLPGTVPFTSTQSLPGAHILSMASILFLTPPVTSATSSSISVDSRVSLVITGMSSASGSCFGLSVYRPSMSDTNTTRSGLNTVARYSIIWSPDTMANPFLRSMTTSPNVTGMMPMWACLRRASSSVTTSLPSSRTKQSPGGKEDAGMPTFMSSEVTSSPSSIASWWTIAAAETCP